MDLIHKFQEQLGGLFPQKEGGWFTSPIMQVMVFIFVSKVMRMIVNRVFNRSPSSQAPGGLVRAVHNKAEWDEELRKAKEDDNRLVVVDFTAVWCGPCRRLGPQFAKLSEEYTDHVFLKVDVDGCKEVARMNNIKCMPTIKAFKDGKCVQTIEGGSPDLIVKMISDHK
mmetsp:Transcript_39222/g.54459  ORF Transcript_39222/g.54459 Transcript_39222/m.54459 type:complete len:168 (-) Transcript_39222:98-601(-)